MSGSHNHQPITHTPTMSRRGESWGRPQHHKLKSLFHDRLLAPTHAGPPSKVQHPQPNVSTMSPNVCQGISGLYTPRGVTEQRPHPLCIFSDIVGAMAAPANAQTAQGFGPPAPSPPHWKRAAAAGVGAMALAAAIIWIPY